MVSATADAMRLSTACCVFGEEDTAKNDPEASFCFGWNGARVFEVMFL